MTGHMFGKGIYFADMSSKSAQYCDAEYSDHTALLLLCEVELGHVVTTTHEDCAAKTAGQMDGKFSVWGRGKYVHRAWQDAGVVHPELRGVEMVSLVFSFPRWMDVLWKPS